MPVMAINIYLKNHNLSNHGIVSTTGSSDGSSGFSGGSSDGLSGFSGGSSGVLVFSSGFI